MCQRGDALLQVHYRHTDLSFFCRIHLSLSSFLSEHVVRAPLLRRKLCVLRQRLLPCAAPRLCTDNPPLLISRGAVSKWIFPNSLLGKVFEQFVAQALLLLGYSKLSEQLVEGYWKPFHMQTNSRKISHSILVIYKPLFYLHDLRTCRCN